MVKETFEGNTRLHRLEFQADADSIEVTDAEGNVIESTVFNASQNVITCSGRFTNGEKVTVNYDKRKEMKHSEENDNQEDDENEEAD